jgi:hypothetical protein
LLEHGTMMVKPLLGDWEIPNIAGIETLERRELAELEVPGRVGSLFQDLNAAPTRIVIHGSLFGDEKRNEFLQAAREKFRAGEPVTFVADIITATEVQFVLIETMHFAEQGEAPQETSYFLQLRESPPPPPPPDPLGGLDAGLLDAASGLLDTVAGALDALDALANVPDLQDPTPPLRGMLDGVSTAVEGLTSVTGAIGELFGGEE